MTDHMNFLGSTSTKNALKHPTWVEILLVKLLPREF